MKISNRKTMVGILLHHARRPWADPTGPSSPGEGGEAVPQALKLLFPPLASH